MDLQLKDKAAIVTGGSRGIGKAIARQLAREGVDVAIVSRDLSARRRLRKSRRRRAVADTEILRFGASLDSRAI